MRIGLMGGSFNPIHASHLAIADAAHEALHLEVVLVVPAPSPPHKSTRELAPGEHRLEMAKLATRSRDWIMVSSIEFERPGPSYTIDTVSIFHTFFKDDVELFLIIGSDTVPELRTWRAIGDLVKLVQFAVVDRGGRNVEADLAAAPSGARLHRVRVATPSSLSATAIRRSGDLKDVAPEVAAYIRKQGLYGYSPEP